MEIKRCTQAFRSGGNGASAGDLFPSTHALVKRFPKFFEPVEDFVARKHPKHAAKAEEPKAPPAPRKAPAKRAAAPKPKEG